MKQDSEIGQNKHDGKEYGKVHYHVTENERFEKESKKKKEEEAKYPKNVKELRLFLDWAKFYEEFVKDFESITAPLYNLLLNKLIFNFTPECKMSFNKIEKILKEDDANEETISKTYDKIGRSDNKDTTMHDMIDQIALLKLVTHGGYVNKEAVLDFQGPKIGSINFYVTNDTMCFRIVKESDRVSYVPDKVDQNQLVKEAHERGHNSPTMTIGNLNKDFRWKSMKSDVMDLCMNCQGCAINGPNPALWRPNEQMNK